jgi:SOS-response transcriptional repressor LexA
MDQFTINTKTTGFGSPARAYVNKRLDPNDLLITDPYSTFFFQWEGEEKFGLQWGDYLVVDRSSTPQPEDLVIVSGSEKLSLDIYKNINPENLWGVITWKLCQLKK